MKKNHNQSMEGPCAIGHKRTQKNWVGFAAARNLLLLALTTAGAGETPKIAEQQLAAAAVRVFDSGKPSTNPLKGGSLVQRQGWSELEEDSQGHRFSGDAVLMNERLALVLRGGAMGAEVYSLGQGGAVLRTILAPMAGDVAGKLSAVALVENNRANGVADVDFTDLKGRKLRVRFEIKLGQPVVQTEAREGVTGLRNEAPCRFAVMPDFFADDIVIDATGVRVSEAELPADNFLLQLVPGGQAVVMTVVKNAEEDLRVHLSGEGQQRMIRSSEWVYGKQGKIWVAVLTAPGIWHQQEVTPEQAGQVIRLEWRTPFPAQWRVDWQRPDKLIDSWEMLAERSDGSFTRHALYGGPETIPANRKRWTTVLGQFQYPAWIDKSGQGCLQPLKSPALRFEGPAIIYPMSRVTATGLDTFTVVDVVRNTLGAGPCEYILDLEGQKSMYKGRATCSVRDTLNPIYAAKQQKERRTEIDKVLQDLMIFIRHIRGRIEGYVEFGHTTLAYLQKQKTAQSELAEPLNELESLARMIDARVAARRLKIRTPEEVALTVEEFRKTVLEYEGDDALARCKQFTADWVEVGGNQDELVGECRWAVKMIRQRAGLLVASEPRLAETAKEIRRRSQAVLRNPAGHEAARH